MSAAGASDDWPGHYQELWPRLVSTDSELSIPHGVSDPSADLDWEGAELQKKQVVVQTFRRQVYKKVHLNNPVAKKHWGTVRARTISFKNAGPQAERPGRLARVAEKLAPVVTSPRFERAVAAVVLLNGLCVAIEVDLHPPERWPHLLRALNVSENIFVLFFCCESAAKTAIFGLRKMLTTPRYRFELVLCLAGALDIWLLDFRMMGSGFDNADFGLSLLSCLRLARSGRAFASGELGVIARCFFPAFSTLLHVSCFLFLIIFIFSVPAVRLVGQNPIWRDNESLPEVEQLFGSFPRAVFGLVQMMINPDTALILQMSERQPWTAPFFLVFVLMTTYTTMSIIVGSITDTYKELSDAERARRGRAEREQQDMIRWSLLEELRAADSAEPGLSKALSAAEFQRRLRSPGFQAALQALGADRETVAELLGLLQIDGHVYYEEFTDALGLLGRSAQATHLLALRAHLSEDIRNLEKDVKSVGQRLGDRMEALEHSLAQRLDAGLTALRADLLVAQRPPAAEAGADAQAEAPPRSPAELLG